MLNLQRSSLLVAASLALLGAAAGPVWCQAFNLSVLHTFGDGNVTKDGVNPAAPLVESPSGDFYGTTGNGGSAGSGCVFKLTTGGTLTILHNFGDGSVTNDGNAPNGLLLASDGNYYGTTYDGGAGQGVVYKMTPAGTVTILHSFGDGSVANDGAYPSCVLIESGGLLYGTTVAGGAELPAGNLGTVFSISTTGTYAVLHRFLNADGANPYAGLVDGQDGFFYGLTYSHGTVGGNVDVGTAYKITPSGTFTAIHGFLGGTDGAYPYAPLMLGSDGNLYGMTSAGGVNNYANGHGTFFRMTKAGAVTVLHAFSGQPHALLPNSNVPADGGMPISGLIQDSSGTIYGATSQGGLYPGYLPGNGSVFSYTSSGIYSVIASFGVDAGKSPAASLLKSSNGDLYGTTDMGGSASSGVVFRLHSGTVGPTSNFLLTTDYTNFTFPLNTDQGSAFPFNIAAYDATGNPTPAYTGTVHFASTDSLTILPGDSALTNGLGDFNVTPYNVADVTGTDTVTPSITGGGLHLTPNPVALIVAPPRNVTAGVPFSFTVTAHEHAGTVRGYTGNLVFSTNASGATLPTSGSGWTNGVATYTATFTHAGTLANNFKISAHDGHLGSISGTSIAIAVAAAPVKLFTITVPSTAADGTAFNAVVTAKDAYGNVVTGYTGTVHFTSTDAFAVLPANATLTNGVGTFSVTLHNSGPQTVTATDTVTSTIKGTSTSILVSSPATYFVVACPHTATTGTPFSFTVMAQDKYNRRVGGYTGTVHFSSNTTHITLPSNSTLVHGVATFSATMTANVNCKITASDVATTSIRGTSVTITSGP